MHDPSSISLFVDVKTRNAVLDLLPGLFHTFHQICATPFDVILPRAAKIGLPTCFNLFNTQETEMREPILQQQRSRRVQLNHTVALIIEPLMRHYPQHTLAALLSIVYRHRQQNSFSSVALACTTENAAHLRQTASDEASRSSPIKSAPAPAALAPAEKEEQQTPPSWVVAMLLRATGPSLHAFLSALEPLLGPASDILAAAVSYNDSTSPTSRPSSRSSSVL